MHSDDYSSVLGNWHRAGKGCMEIKNVMMSIAGAVLLVLICWSWQNRKFSRMQLKGIMAKMCFQITGTPDEVLADAIKILNKLKWSEDMFGKDDVL